jgi:hypothetical protein
LTPLLAQPESIAAAARTARELRYCDRFINQFGFG